MTTAFQRWSLPMTAWPQRWCPQWCLRASWGSSALRLWWNSTTVELLMGGDDGPGDDNPAGVQVVDVVHNSMLQWIDDLGSTAFIEDGSRKATPISWSNEDQSSCWLLCSSSSFYCCQSSSWWRSCCCCCCTSWWSNLRVWTRRELLDLRSGRCAKVLVMKSLGALS